MAQPTSIHGFDVYTIQAADGSIEASFVPEKGGIGSSIRVMEADGPREILFRHPFFWDAPPVVRTPGGWPFLFPICGRLERDGQAEAYRYNDRLYRMPIHGFSMRVPWAVEPSESDDELVMTLRDSEATRPLYPFAFLVRLRYRVEARRLICEQTYRNTGEAPLPYYAGFHPYFAVPEPGAGKEATQLHMTPTARCVYNDRLTDTIDRAAPPAMPVSIADPGIHENLLRVGEGHVTRLSFPDRPGWALEARGVETPGLFPYVQLYTMTDKPFFCIEPWMGAPNGLNTFGACRVLRPGEEEHGMTTLSTDA